MCKLICVTNRRLVKGDFLRQIGKIAAAKPDSILLREKDMPPAEYAALAGDVMALCTRYGVKCILHSHPADGGKALHLPLPVLREKASELQGIFQVLGASCHSVDEAREAVSLGADYIIAGHIFATDCKRGLPGRGLDFLRNIVQSVDVPVYAIGGISPENAGAVIQAGASGVCVMSSLMESDDPAAEIKALRRAMEHEA